MTMAKYLRVAIWLTLLSGIPGGAYWLYGIATGGNSPLELIGGCIALAIVAVGFRSGRVQRDKARATIADTAGQEVRSAAR